MADDDLGQRRRSNVFRYVPGLAEAETKPHKRLEEVAEAKGIHMTKQSARTPELNGHDLGFWHGVAATHDHRWQEFIEYIPKKADLLDKIWDVTKESFESFPPEKIYSIFEHKLDVAREIVKLGGAALREEPHDGARKRTREAILAARHPGWTTDFELDLPLSDEE